MRGMTRRQALDVLPLKWDTPVEWAHSVLVAPLPLLNDHAWLEKKAAGNALELLHRWPEPNPPENWVTAMTAIARDEVDHLAVVARLVVRRGGRLTKSHANPYATALRELVRWSRGPEELVDRLMVSALIEARSCERFFLLGEACTDRELAKLYRGLYASEAGHYTSFIDLARQLTDLRRVNERWEEMLESESEIIQRQAPGPRIHSGME